MRQSFRSPELELETKAAIVTLNRSLFDKLNGRSSKVHGESLPRLNSKMVQLVSEATCWKISLEVED